MTSLTLKPMKVNGRSKTSLPKTRLNCEDFTRSITPDLKQLDNFCFVEYYGQRHTHPQRVHSARERGVSSLKITYFTADHVAYLQNSSIDLQRLDLSNSNLFKFPFGVICNMSQLQVLILDYNQLNEFSFCHEFCNVLSNSLKEISACFNNLSCWPESIDNLNKLLRLKMSQNLLISIKGVEKFKRLKMLNVDNNRLTQLGNSFYLIKRLEYAYISHNQLTSISVEIKHLSYLKEVDLSYNSLKTVPPDIFLLQNIEIIKLNDNKICKLPKFKITGKLSKNILLVDLSSNNIARFPDCIMRITANLDLSNNKIRMISPNILKKISYTTSQKLSLLNNPLCSPPKEICESGLKCMIQYQQQSETIRKDYHGLKVFCVAPENINKSKILSSLIDHNDDDDSVVNKEIILDFFETAFEVHDKKIGESLLLNLQFVDISINDNDTSMLTLFMTCPALVILFVDVDNYSKTFFNDALGMWIQQFIIKQNEISFMLVGITNSKTDNNQCETVKEIQNDVKDFFDNYTEKILVEIHKIESKSKINASMSLALKKFLQLKSIKVFVHEKCILINSKNSELIKLLRSEIITVGTKTNIFNKVMSPIPSFWADVQLFFEEESYKFPLMNINEFEILMQQKFNLKQAAFKISNFLHETGNFLWWENSHSPLNQWIVTCPLSLVECLRVLFRPDLKTYLEDPSDPDRNLKRFKKRFNKSKYSYKECCNVLFDKSVLLPELVIILWENILPLNSIIRMLFYFCECWSLGYLTNYSQYPQPSWKDLNKDANGCHLETVSSADSVEYRLKSADSTKSTGSSQNNLPPIFCPQFLTRNKILNEINKMWIEMTEFRISVSYKFTLGLPKIILNQILVRANNSERPQTQLQDHWTDGIQAGIENTKIIFRIFYHRQINSGHDFIKYEFQYVDDLSRNDFSNDTAKVQFANIWQAMLPYLTDTDQFLESYRGLWYERLIECPYCKKEFFQGTWNTLNDNLLAEDRYCQLCDKCIPSYILHPPQMDKNVSSEEIIKSIRRQFDRN